MLDKTFKMLSEARLGSDDQRNHNCYDPEEIDALASLLNRLVYAPPSLRQRIERIGKVTITRADFYSQIPTVDELEESESRPLTRYDYPFQDGIFLRDFLTGLMPYAGEFNPPTTAEDPDKFAWNMGGFSYSDAMAYYSIVRQTSPKTIIELGCGTSTLVAQSALKMNGGGRHICVEPYPNEMIRSLSDIELHDERAQTLKIEFFNDNLSDGDIVFIDTTHTVKHDSDCLHLYLRLLPEIRRDIYVHVHDIYLPFPFDVRHQMKHQIYWMEQYLLLAYLTDNPRTRTLFGSHFHSSENADLLKDFMHGRFASGGASFWFHQAKRGTTKT